MDNVKIDFSANTVDREMLSYLQSSISKVKRRAKDKNRKFNLDIKYLLKLMKRQNNRCNLTGLNFDIGDKKFRPSIDRINSNLGYQKGNIQLLCSWANIAKWDLNQDVFLNWCKLVVEHNSEPRNVILKSNKTNYYMNSCKINPLSKSDIIYLTGIVDSSLVVTCTLCKDGKLRWNSYISNKYQSLIDKLKDLLGVGTKSNNKLKFNMSELYNLSNLIFPYSMSKFRHLKLIIDYVTDIMNNDVIDKLFISDSIKQFNRDNIGRHVLFHTAREYIFYLGGFYDGAGSACLTKRGVPIAWIHSKVKEPLEVMHQFSCQSGKLYGKNLKWMTKDLIRGLLNILIYTIIGEKKLKLYHVLGDPIPIREPGLKEFL
jgi:hypothetical protein